MYYWSYHTSPLLGLEGYTLCASSRGSSWGGRRWLVVHRAQGLRGSNSRRLSSEWKCQWFWSRCHVLRRDAIAAPNRVNVSTHCGSIWEFDNIGDWTCDLSNCARDPLGWLHMVKFSTNTLSPTVKLRRGFDESCDCFCLD